MWRCFVKQMEPLLKVTTSKWDMQSEILKRVGEGQKEEEMGDRQRQIRGESLTSSIVLKSQMSCGWMEADADRQIQKTMTVWQKDMIVGRKGLEISFIPSPLPPRRSLLGTVHLA